MAFKLARRIGGSYIETHCVCYSDALIFIQNAFIFFPDFFNYNCNQKESRVSNEIRSRCFENNYKRHTFNLNLVPYFRLICSYIVGPPQPE